MTLAGPAQVGFGLSDHTVTFSCSLKQCEGQRGLRSPPPPEAVSAGILALRGSQTWKSLQQGLMKAHLGLQPTPPERV